MSDDADLIRKMMVAWFPNETPMKFEGIMALCQDDMARVLAVVREHDAGPARRVPVQIATEVSDGSPAIICLASDHTLHQGWWESGKFTWRDQLPPLPQPGGGA